jgi:hypothetical protein
MDAKVIAILTRVQTTLNNPLLEELLTLANKPEELVALLKKALETNFSADLKKGLAEVSLSEKSYILTCLFTLAYYYPSLYTVLLKFSAQ